MHWDNLDSCRFFTTWRFMRERRQFGGVSVDHRQCQSVGYRDDHASHQRPLHYSGRFDAPARGQGMTPVRTREAAGVELLRVSGDDWVQRPRSG